MGEKTGLIRPLLSLPRGYLGCPAQSMPHGSPLIWRGCALLKFGAEADWPWGVSLRSQSASPIEWFPLRSGVEIQSSNLLKFVQRGTFHFTFHNKSFRFRLKTACRSAWEVIQHSIYKTKECFELYENLATVQKN